jgi:hypothetical protein
MDNYVRKKKRLCSDLLLIFMHYEHFCCITQITRRAACGDWQSLLRLPSAIIIKLDSAATVILDSNLCYK